MRGTANCSEMVMIFLTIVLYVSRLALLLKGIKGIFSDRTVHYKIQVGLCAFKTFLALQTYVMSVIITTMN